VTVFDLERNKTIPTSPDKDASKKNRTRVKRPQKRGLFVIGKGDVVISKEREPTQSKVRKGGG